MTDHRETPVGFLLHAQEFLTAAQLVLGQTSSVSLPAYFLLGRAIELSLKAFLMGVGVPIEKLRTKKFGHDLTALLDAARGNGLDKIVPLTETEIGAICLLNCDYLEKRFEYRVTGGTYHLPFIDDTERITRKLIVGLESYSAFAEADPDCSGGT